MIDPNKNLDPEDLNVVVFYVNNKSSFWSLVLIRVMFRFHHVFRPVDLQGNSASDVFIKI